MAGEGARCVGVDDVMVTARLSTEGRREPVGVGVRADAIDGLGEDNVDMFSATKSSSG